MPKLPYPLLFLALSGCATPPTTCNCESVAKPEQTEAIPPATNNAQQEITKLFKYIEAEAKKYWGDEKYLNSGEHRYIKYLDRFQTRAHIDFLQGNIFVSTLAQTDPIAKLKAAIVQTVLMPADPKQVDSFSDKPIAASTKPFFLAQILDQDGQPIQWQWRANRFADFLIAHHLQIKKTAKGKAHFVEIQMVDDHLAQREYQFAPLVRQAAKRYGISEALIVAVIKTESSFNPYAVSHSGAYGLMQVMPKTAGADVFKLIKNQSGIPTQAYLFNPENNIDTGAAYLHLLKNRYLKELSDPTSLHFSVVSAYNSGTGGVLSTFDPDKKRAISEINRRTPKQVYTALTTHHPKQEARRYLQKVLYFQKDFTDWAG